MRSGPGAPLGEEWASFICILQRAPKSTRIPVAPARGAIICSSWGAGGGAEQGGGVGLGGAALNSVWAGEIVNRLPASCCFLTTLEHGGSV